MNQYHYDFEEKPKRGKASVIIGTIVVLIVCLVLIFIVKPPAPPTCTDRNMPEIQGLTASSQIVPSGSPVTLTVVAVDPNGSALTYLWTATNGSLQTPQGKPISGAIPDSTIDYVAPSISGTFTITVQAKNAECASAEKKLAIQVFSATQPTSTPTEILLEVTDIATTTILPSQSLTILTSPAQCTIVDSAQVVSFSIEGTSTGIKGTDLVVYLIIRPISSSSIWIQNPPVGRLVDDDWIGNVSFGGRDTYEVWAVATDILLTLGEADPTSLPAPNAKVWISSKPLRCQK